MYYLYYLDTLLEKIIFCMIEPESTINNKWLWHHSDF